MWPITHVCSHSSPLSVLTVMYAIQKGIGMTRYSKLFQKNHTMKEIWIVIQISLISAVLWFSTRKKINWSCDLHKFMIFELWLLLCVWVALLVGIVRVNWVIKPSALEMKLQLLDSLITVNTKKKSKKGYKGKTVGHWKSQISILGALIMSLTMTLH